MPKHEKEARKSDAHLVGLEIEENRRRGGKGISGTNKRKRMKEIWGEGREGLGFLLVLSFFLQARRRASLRIHSVIIKF